MAQPLPPILAPLTVASARALCHVTYGPGCNCVTALDLHGGGAVSTQWSPGRDTSLPTVAAWAVEALHLTNVSEVVCLYKGNGEKKDGYVLLFRCDRFA